MNAFHRLHELRMENTQAGYDMDEKRGRFDRLKNRHTNGTAPVAVSAFQLFQTPVAIAHEMVSRIEFKTGFRVLEPSAGLGRIMGAIPEGIEVVAIEKAASCAAQLYQMNRPGMTLMQRDFLTVSPEGIGRFDAVLMNPPFHLRDDIAHIQHATQFLKPGGKLVALCMATKHREEALRPLCSFWKQLPQGSFSKEGTGVDVVMLEIRSTI